MYLAAAIRAKHRSQVASSDLRRFRDFFGRAAAGASVVRDLCGGPVGAVIGRRHGCECVEAAAPWDVGTDAAKTAKMPTQRHYQPRSQNR
jgi:hypothetical protein